jgi:hypothetical protein
MASTSTASYEQLEPLVPALKAEIFGHTVTTDIGMGDVALVFKLKGTETDSIWAEEYTNPRGMIEKVIANYPRDDPDKGSKKGTEIKDKIKAKFPENKMTKKAYFEEAMNIIINEIITCDQFGAAVKLKVSVDEDEVFVGIRLIEEVLPMTAERWGYKMKVKQDLLGPDAPKCTADGEPYPVHVVYFDEFMDKFVPFREVDRIRLVFRQLNYFFHLDKMKAQGLIVKDPLVLHDFVQVEKLLKDAGDIKKCWKWHSDEEINALRDYLGEEVAWFFLFTKYMTKKLIIPSVVAAMYRIYVSFIIPEEDKEEPETVDFINILRFIYGVIVLIWASTLIGGFGRVQSSFQVKWGMQNYGVVSEVQKSYDESKEQTMKLNLIKGLTPVLSAVVLGVMVYGMVEIMALRMYWIEHDRKFMFGMVNGAAMGGYCIVALIKFLDQVWNQTCNILVNNENHRTSGEKEKARIYKIVYVKLIVVLYPYLYTAFRKRHILECREDAEGAETCLPGLSKDLAKYFMIHIAICIAKIVAFTYFGKRQVTEEYARAKKEHGNKEYSYVEVQAKLLPAPGITDEYTELMVSFALVCLFGTVLPSMSLLLFLANLVEVRLLAYRYLRATGRPRPSGAEDIGAWDYCFDFTTQISLIVMPALLVFEMHPLRDSKTTQEFEYFLGIEHFFILIKLVLMGLYAKAPFDVRKAAIFAEEKATELFSSSKRGNIQLPATYKPSIEANFKQDPVAAGVLPPQLAAKK